MHLTHFVSTGLIMAICLTGMFSPIAISYHDGAMVVDGGVSFQLNGVIFGGYKEHEYGHYEQQLRMGDMQYYSTVALPSLVVNVVANLLVLVTGEFPTPEWYYNLHWEDV